MQGIDIEQQFIFEAEADRFVRAATGESETRVTTVAVLDDLQTIDGDSAIILIGFQRKAIERVIGDSRLLLPDFTPGQERVAIGV